MSYSTRSKKKLMGEGGPAGDMENELIKQKPKVDKPFDASKTQRPKETSHNEIGTPVISVDTSSPSNNNGTSGILLDERSNDEQLKNENLLKPLPSTGPKHSKNGDEATGKTKKILRYDSFIYKENDDRYYLYHKYWRIPYRVDKDLFQCPKCSNNIRLECKIGFVMVSDKNWHKDNKCLIRCRPAPEKGHRFKVPFKPANQEKTKFRNEVVTKKDVDNRRKSLEKQGYKPILDPLNPAANRQNEAEIPENDDVSSEENEYDGADSDLDEPEELRSL